MKNIFGTQDNIRLYDEKKMLKYKYYSVVDYRAQITYDSNGKVLTFEDSDGNSANYTRDSKGEELTFESSDGTRRGFDELIIKDSDIATIEALHDLLLDSERYPLYHPALKKSRELTHKLYKIIRKDEKH